MRLAEERTPCRSGSAPADPDLHGVRSEPPMARDARHIDEPQPSLVPVQPERRRNESRVSSGCASVTNCFVPLMYSSKFPENDVARLAILPVLLLLKSSWYRKEQYYIQYVIVGVKKEMGRKKRS